MARSIGCNHNLLQRRGKDTGRENQRDEARQIALASSAESVGSSRWCAMPVLSCPVGSFLSHGRSDLRGRCCCCFHPILVTCDPFGTTEPI